MHFQGLSAIPVSPWIVAVVLAATAGAFTGAWGWIDWDVEAKLLPPYGAPDFEFGRSVALDGDTALVGSSGVTGGSGPGSVYVFTRSDGAWTEQAVLSAPDTPDTDLFGMSVALDGDTALVGSSLSTQVTVAGAVYVFVRTGGVWTEQAKLTPSDGQLFDSFGFAVALDGDTAVIGASRDDDNDENSGSAYVFVRSGDVWTQAAKLLPSDGASEDRFGETVALDGETAVIGASEDDDAGWDAGSVYVFTRAAGVWTEQAKLLPDGDASEDGFGRSVAIERDTLLIGERGNDENGEGSGAVHVFIRTAGLWTRQATLRPSDGAAEDYFGRFVAIDGGTAVIGAPGDDPYAESSGSAYVFSREGEVWTKQAKLAPSDGGISDGFGSRGGFDGDTAVIVAFGDDDVGENAGSAYVIRLYDGDVLATDDQGVVALLIVVACIGVFLTRGGELMGPKRA